MVFAFFQKSLAKTGILCYTFPDKSGRDRSARFRGLIGEFVTILT